MLPFVCVFCFFVPLCVSVCFCVSVSLCLCVIVLLCLLLSMLVQCCKCCSVAVLVQEFDFLLRLFTFFLSFFLSFFFFIFFFFAGFFNEKIITSSIQ